jgi:GntR family transcriptional regulator, transcriptional repressor for pyruvate dehydrogenase complex
MKNVKHDKSSKRGGVFNMSKINTRKLSEQVEEQLEQWIVTERFREGDKLPSVRELCEHFDVGRSAVRDAVTALKGKGMVEVRQGEGTFVCAYNAWQVLGTHVLTDTKSIRDLYTVRQMLEVQMAELAARKRTTAHIESMERTIAALRNADGENGWKADYTFHQTLARATGNRMLVQLIEAVSSFMKKALLDCHRLISSDPDLSASIEKQHLRILEAIRHQNGSEARTAMQEHLSDVEQLLKRTLQQKLHEVPIETSKMGGGLA